MYSVIFLRTFRTIITFKMTDLSMLAHTEASKQLNYNERTRKVLIEYNTNSFIIDNKIVNV